MNFTHAPTTENFATLRFVSDGGRWELGLRPMIFGVRVSAAIVGDMGCCLDYCAGDDPLFQMELLDCVKTIMRSIPEDINIAAFEAIWPDYTIRPILQ